MKICFYAHSSVDIFKGGGRSADEFSSSSDESNSNEDKESYGKSHWFNYKGLTFIEKTELPW